MERYLIINADDYGVCLSANEAVEHLFNDGFITSTTLMTPCPWAEEALMRAKNNNKMRVGLHLTFNAEWGLYKWGPVSRTGPVSSLLDQDGYFFSQVAPFLSKAEAVDIVTEMEAQFAYMINRGYKPTHADNHMGSLYGLEGPSYLKEVLEFCSRHDLDFRLPKSTETFGPLPEELKQALGELAKMAEGMGVSLIDNLCSHPYELTPNDTYETVREYYLNLIRNAPAGITELFLHPAKETEELKAICSDWQKRVWEYRLMLDHVVMKTIESEGIKLIGWTDMRRVKR